MISIVIPLYKRPAEPLDRERWAKWLEVMNQKPQGWRWIVVEIRSDQQQKLELLPWLLPQLTTPVLLKNIVVPKPTRAESFNKAIAFAKGEHILLLHEDCHLNFEDLELLQKQLTANSWGGFYKKYNQSNILLSISAHLQNCIRFKLGGNLVGTNGLLFPQSFWKAHPFENCFLEDVAFSDRAKKVLGKPQVFKGYLSVSARRYLGQGVLFCVVVNSLILMAYRLGVPPLFLSKFYQKKQAE